MAASPLVAPLDSFWRPFDRQGLVLEGMRAPINVAEAITEARIERSMNGPGLFTLGVFDPDHRLMREASYFGRDDGVGESRRWAQVTVKVDGVVYALSEIEKQAGVGYTFTFYDAAAAKLKRTTGAVKAKRQAMTRAEFVRGLCLKAGAEFIDYRGVDAAQIVQAITPDDREALQTVRATGVVGFAPATLSGRGLTVKGVQADREQLRNIERVLAVAANENAPRKAAQALVEACIVESLFRNVTGGTSSSVGILQLLNIHLNGSTSTSGGRRDIELVCRMFLREGFTGQGGAIALARRNPTWTAGQIAQAVQGSAYPDHYDQYAHEAVKILDQAGVDRDLDAVAAVPDRAYVRRYEFRVDSDESYWSAGVRLAEEVGWRFYALNNKIWFISDPKLMSFRPRLVLREEDEGVDSIEFIETAAGRIDTITVACRLPKWAAMPGQVVVVEGEGGTAYGRWLVRSIERDRLDPSAQATLKLGKMQSPKAEPRPHVITVPGIAGGRTDKPGGGRYPSGEITARGGARGIVEQAAALAIKVAGSPAYVSSSHRVGDDGDHGGNDSYQAARDIAIPGVNPTGPTPPIPQLNRAAVAVAAAFGMTYAEGQTIDVGGNGIEFHGYRIQMFWRTYTGGNHYNHIHVGARRL